MEFSQIGGRKDKEVGDKYSRHTLSEKNVELQVLVNKMFS